MSEIDLKAIKAFSKELNNIWWIENPTFRNKFNKYLAEALVRGRQTGDLTHTDKLIKAIPDKTVRDKVMRKALKDLPLSLNAKTEAIVKDKTRWAWFSLEAFSAFLGVTMNDFIEQKDNNVLINKVSLESQEFVDFVLDTITLNRNHFSVQDLEKISETLGLVKDRLESTASQ